jgi:DNA-binding NarL/FixJ family response regulator
MMAGDQREEVPMVTTETVKVLIVDDQAPFRSVARTVVGLTAGFSVAAEAETGEEAVERADSVAPDLVLMDINMPGINGVEATRRIKARHPAAVVILASTYQADDLPAGADECGAAAYVHKEDMSPAMLADVWASHHPDGCDHSARCATAVAGRRTPAASPIRHEATPPVATTTTSTTTGTVGVGTTP